MQSKEHSYIGPRAVRPLKLSSVAGYQDLSRIGIGMDAATVHRMMAAMDAALVPGLTTPTITTPEQFLQNWLPGFVAITTAARTIDECVGITTAGAWEDEEVVQGVMELTGTSVPYGDYTNVPLSSWNVNFERRTVVRFEEGMRVGTLEEARASRMKVNSAEGKREAATLALEINRNRVGFYGYNDGNNRTYGLLNDPSLPAYVTLPMGGANSTQWASKTFLEITADIRTMVADLRNQTRGVIDPKKEQLTLVLGTSVIDYLTVTSIFSVSVQDWLTKTYPTMRVVSCPEFDAAHAGDNVAYLYAESVSDQSTDGGQTFVQVVPAKFRVLGVQQLAKGYEEDYSNATAGVMCKRPYAVVRRTGL
ncbi:major capsid family protein [Mycetohabitans sp. B46]|uniref:major capsid family protein n=1 Tax=Mycetohabitans sp. B46 TaxID=2772536 RepID=UPI00307DCC24